jgi:hypothetical protein
MLARVRDIRDINGWLGYQTTILRGQLEALQKFRSDLEKSVSALRAVELASAFFPSMAKLIASASDDIEAIEKRFEGPLERAKHAVQVGVAMDVEQKFERFENTWNKFEAGILGVAASRWKARDLLLNLKTALFDTRMEVPFVGSDDDTVSIGFKISSFIVEQLDVYQPRFGSKDKFLAKRNAALELAGDLAQSVLDMYALHPFAPPTSVSHYQHILARKVKGLEEERDYQILPVQNRYHAQLAQVISDFGIALHMKGLDAANVNIFTAQQTAFLECKGVGFSPGVAKNIFSAKAVKGLAQKIGNENVDAKRLAGENFDLTQKADALGTLGALGKLLGGVESRLAPFEVRDARYIAGRGDQAIIRMLADLRRALSLARKFGFKPGDVFSIEAEYKELRRSGMFSNRIVDVLSGWQRQGHGVPLQTLGLA